MKKKSIQITTQAPNFASNSAASVSTPKTSRHSMTFGDIFALSTRIFRTRPLRTSLTILGMSVGIGAVLFLVSLGYGLQETVLNRITTADALLSLDVTAGESELIALNPANVEKIAALPHVAEVSPVVALPAETSLNDVAGSVVLYSVKPSFFNLSGLTTSHGRLFGSGENGSSGREIVVSSALAKIFNVEPEQILGKSIFLTAFVSSVSSTEEDATVSIIQLPESFTIVGVIDDEKEGFVYAPASQLTEIPVNTYIGVKVKVESSEYMESLREEIIGMGFFVSVLQDTIDQVTKIFVVIQVVLGLFGLVALIVSAIGMFNTMTVVLLERTNEIGIMRSIGVTKSDVRKLFIFEALIMGFLGGLGGVILGYLAGFIANFGINILAKNFGGQALDLFSRPPSFVLIIIIFSTVIGFLTGVFPARRAGKLNPLDALRYK